MDIARQALFYKQMKLIEHFDDYPIVDDQKTQYLRYRMGRLKHQIWLTNRKRNQIIIDTHDKFIIDHVQPGNTAIFGSAGYYLEDLIDNLTVIEQHEIVKTFYPKATIVKNRSDIAKIFGQKFDNFIVNNNRADHWVDIKGIADHIHIYAMSMKTNCLLFYSFRDTQINKWNRLTTDHVDYFMSLLDLLPNFKCEWHDIKFKKEDDMMENPDTTNGNIKFMLRLK